MTTRPRLHILTGCTAVGKTAVALEWAEQAKAEIVSCDSLLFYRGMNLGTAKPTPAELARVPHHLVDVIGFGDRMDVRSYLARARAAVADITARGRRVLVTGGSGFYLRSFFAPVADDVPFDPALREQLESQLRTEGLEPLVERLRALNATGLGELDVRNPRRVVRALERCLISGRTLVELQSDFRGQPPPFPEWDLELVELVREPADLRTRIAARVHAMLSAGLIDEVRALREVGLQENPSARRAIGYRETLAWLDAGESDVAPLAAEIIANTWALVRKQRTWFRTQLPAHRVIELPAGTEARSDDLFRREK